MRKERATMLYEKTVLDNGISVLTKRIDDVRSAAVELFFKTGSRDESPEEAGISHFMEHMIFAGTAAHSRKQIPVSFETLGASYNGITSEEWTCYYANGIDKNLPQAFEVLADMVSHPLVKADDIESECMIIIEEISRREDNPNVHLGEAFKAALLPHHPLGLPIPATRESVRRYSYDDFRRFYDKRYCGRNLIVSAAGNVEHETVVALCEKLLSEMPAGSETQREAPTEDAALPLVFLDNDERQAFIQYGTRSYPEGHPDRFAAELLDCALGGTMSSRLYEQVCAKGLSTGINAGSNRYSDFGAFCVSTRTDPADVRQVVGIIRPEVERIAAEGITQKELDRVRSCTKGRLARMTDTAGGIADQLGTCALSGMEPLSRDERIELFDAVTLDDCQRVAEDIYARPMTLAVSSPRGAAELEKTFAESA